MNSKLALVSIVFVFLVIIFGVIYGIRQSQDLRNQAAGSCSLMIQAQRDAAPGPITGTLSQSGNTTVCRGEIGDTYLSYYPDHNAVRADLLTVHYPCQNFKQRYSASCTVNNQQGQSLCVGGPELEYIFCLGSGNALNTIAINPVLSDTAQPTNTPTPIPPTQPPAATNTPTIPPATPTTRPQATNTPAPTTTPDQAWCRQHYPCPASSADLNGDGVVDLSDYAILVNQFSL